MVATKNKRLSFYPNETFRIGRLRKNKDCWVHMHLPPLIWVLSLFPIMPVLQLQWLPMEIQFANSAGMTYHSMTKAPFGTRWYPQCVDFPLGLGLLAKIGEFPCQECTWISLGHQCTDDRMASCIQGCVILWEELETERGGRRWYVKF